MASRRERILLLVTAIVLGMLALDALIFTPIGKRIAALRDEQAGAEAKLLGYLNTLKKRTAAAPMWRKWAHTTLKQDASEAESQMLAAVRSWTREARVNLVSIQPERPSQKGALREIGFHATANGSYEGLVRFLYLLETASIPVRAQRLELRPAKGGGSDYTALDLRFSTIYCVSERGEAPMPRPRSG